MRTIIILVVHGGGGGGGGMAGQGEVLAGEWEQLFSYVKHYIPNTYCFMFSRGYSIGLPIYGLHKNSI